MAIGISDLLNGAQRLQEISKKIEHADIREEIINQRVLLLDAREAFNELREENADLRAQLNAKIDLAGRIAALREVDGLFYDIGEDQKPTGNPYCPACIERDDGLFRLTILRGGYRGEHNCPQCKHRFSVS